MLADYLIPLAAAFAAFAVVMLAAALVLWRRATAAAHGMAALAQTLDARAMTLPRTLSTARSTLAEQAAAAEHALWTLTRLDDRVDAATHAMAARRMELDAFRGRLERAKVGVERLKSAARLIMRAIELRRVFLG